MQILSKVGQTLYFLISLVLVFNTGVSAQDTVKRPLEKALEAMRSGYWYEAKQLAEADGKVARDIILWHEFRSGRGSPTELREFLQRNQDWPGLPYLKEKGEQVFFESSRDEILSWFDEHPPISPSAATIYADALLEAGKTNKAELIVQDKWISEVMDSDLQTVYLRKYDVALSQLHDERSIELLWRDAFEALDDLIPLLSDDYKKLVKAVVALRRYKKDGVNTLINRVPESLRNHPVLNFARFKWRLKYGYDDRAFQLLYELSEKKEYLGRPEIWGATREKLARQLLWDGDYKTSYGVLSSHFVEDAKLKARLEWLAGFVALRKLKDPNSALDHFQNFIEVVESPISIGRGFYWLGRAHEDLNNLESARRAYDRASENYTTYYGQLALEKLGRSLPYDIMDPNIKLQWRNAEFIQSTVFQAAILMLAAEENGLAERFLTHLSENLSEHNLLKLESFLSELDDPHIQIRFGKRQARMGIIVFDSYFALHDMADYQWAVPVDLLLSVARRESEFDQYAKSSAGALGLMQVMPGTAKEMAKNLKIPFEEESLVTSWKYNVLLGATYLQELSYRYRGNPILIAASYNAGPSNADKWIQHLGSPLDRKTNLVDWVEMIPFRETRNYVMRITESLTLYKTLVLGKEIDHEFSEFLGSSAYFSFTPQSE